MSRRMTRWSFLFGVALVLTACGGSGTTSPAASDGGGGGGTTATTAPEATAAPTADSGSGGGSGGGVGDFSGKVCELVTLDEMSAVTTVAASKQDEQPFTQGSGFCTYSGDDGSAVGAISLVGGSMADAKLVFDAYKADASAEAFPVNGGEAIWFANNAVAIVLKNGYTGSVQILAPKDGDMKAASTALLQALADRMP